jgi:hypothetical protein
MKLNPAKLEQVIYNTVRKALRNPMPEGAVCTIPEKSSAKGGRYWVYFRGASEGAWVNAASMTDAKWIFAESQGLHSIAYIAASKKGPKY